MGDFDTIRARLFEREVYGYNGRLSLSAPLAGAQATALQADGSWADVDYDDRERSSWDPSRHLDRTLLLLRASRHRDTGEADRDLMLDGARRAQAFWLKRRPESDNWWHNTIGAPSLLMKILVLFGEDLPDADREASLDILRGVEIGMTGQNRAWVATINFTLGVLVEDAERVETSLREVLGEVKQTEDPEGVQPDWSFHQHGPQLYQGNYGAHFLETVAPFVTLLEGTRFAVSEDHVAVLTGLTLGGTDWMTWGSRMDYHVIGRFISSPHRSRWESEKLIEPCEHLAEVDAASAPALLAFRDRLEQAAAPGNSAPVGNRFFWRSDFMVHRGEDRYLSVRMSSTRTIRSESCNQEGLKNYHLGDGVTLFMRRGDEYDGIFPAWDWKRLPGVTCQRSDAPLPVLSVGKDFGADLFVGGVSDGTDGAAAMRFLRDGVSARKAYFCRGETLVCLGADVCSHARSPVVTSINQCLQKSDVTIGVGDGPKPFLYADRLFGGLEWVHHDEIGYLLMQQMAVDVRKEPQWGAWKEINGNASADRVMRDVFSLWIEHGIGPQDAHYAYAVVMGVDADETAALRQSPAFEITANTEDRQTVRWTDGTVQAVFWKPGEVDLGDGLAIDVNQGCAVMAKRSADRWAVTLANPNQLSERIDLGISRGGKRETRTVDYPTGGMAGSSVTVTV